MPAAAAMTATNDATTNAATTGFVRVGARLIDPRDVTGIEAYGVDERDIDGQIFGFALFLLAATVVAIGVLVFGWRERFLIFTALVGGIGFMSLQDVFLTRPVRVWRLAVRLRDGEMVLFTHPDAQEVTRLRRLLDAQAPAGA